MVSEPQKEKEGAGGPWECERCGGGVGPEPRRDRGHAQAEGWADRCVGDGLTAIGF